MCLAGREERSRQGDLACFYSASLFPLEQLPIEQGQCKMDLPFFLHTVHILPYSFPSFSMFICSFAVLLRLSSRVPR